MIEEDTNASGTVGGSDKKLFPPREMDALCELAERERERDNRMMRSSEAWICVGAHTAGSAKPVPKHLY